MADDYFQSTPNFVNPAYASPEQLATQRAYADALTKRSGENVNRPTGAIANMITALTAGMERNRAAALQSQAAQGNAGDVSALIAQLQKGQTPNAQTMGHIYANPMASPEARGLVGGLVAPAPVKDEFGNPAYTSPSQGVQPAPIAGRPGTYQPSYRVEQGAEGVHTNAPMPAPAAAPAPMPPGASPMGPRPQLDAVSPQGGIFGGMNSRPADWNAPGGPTPVPTVPNTPMTLDQLAAKGRDFAAQREFTQGGAQAVNNVQKSDIAAATTAPAIKRIAGIMLDDITSHGNEMTMGPTADASNNAKKIVANYFPALMGDKQIQGLASADSFDKLSAQLTSVLGSSGGTDAQLFNNMKSVPGAHNSKEGAIALLKMTSQVADQQQALRQAVAGARNAQEYEQMRNAFYAQPQNQIVNPLTGNPIKVDLEQNKTAAAPSYEKTAINKATGERLGLRNGKWEPIK